MHHYVVGILQIGSHFVKIGDQGFILYDTGGVSY